MGQNNNPRYLFVICYDQNSVVLDRQIEVEGKDKQGSLYDKFETQGYNIIVADAIFLAFIDSFVRVTYHMKEKKYLEEFVTNGKFFAQRFDIPDASL